MNTGFAILGFGMAVAVGCCAAEFSQPDATRHPSLFRWTDTCNVYVLRDGDTALLLNLGDGHVLDHLGTIGVKQVEWVLFTDHHREQSQGAARLKETGARVAAPEAERALFERPTDFRKWHVRLEDAHTVYGASYVRPPIRGLPLDHTFGTNDTFTWRGHQFLCLATPGNSPGGMTYLLKGDQGGIAFSGDAMLAGAKMYTWFDTEWDYGFGAGLRALRQSVARLSDLNPTLMLPAHGPPIHRPQRDLTTYAKKLGRLEKLYVRGYGEWADSHVFQDNVSRPTAVSNVVQVSAHLFKFKRPKFWPNFGLILAESGRALVVDCGLLDEALLDAALEGMRRHFGLKAIDAVIVTHMHGDHFLEAPHLRAQWGAKVWALDNMVDKMEHPEWFDYAAPIQGYGKKNPDGSPRNGVTVDRAFTPGERFAWEGYEFTVDWMPGQTEFALCLHGMIDGRKVAFTGDNIFGDPSDPRQTGHEAVVAHNSAVLEEGYIYAGEYLKQLKPDLLIGGHSFVMDRPARFIERYRRWAYEMRDAFQDLSWEKDYRYGFDPFWVRAEPYRVSVAPGQSVDVRLHVRNFRQGRQAHRIGIHTPPGLVADPAVIEGRLPGRGRETFPVLFKALPGANPGVHLVALDVTLDGRRYGQRFDAIVNVTESEGTPRP